MLVEAVLVGDDEHRSAQVVDERVVAVVALPGAGAVSGERRVGTAAHGPSALAKFDGAREEEVFDLLKQADGIFREDAPLWFFNYNKAIIAHQPWVHDIKPVAVEHMFQDFTSIWVEASSPRATLK